MTFSDWILQNGENLQISMFFAFLALLALAERFYPRRPGSLNRRVRWPTNLFLTFLNFVTFSLLPVSFLAVAFWAQSRGWGLLNVLELPLTVMFTANLVLRAFISFFTHYLMHMVPAFWRVHRVHHLDTDLDVTSTVRFHPLEFVVGLLPGIPLVILFGLSPWVLMFYELLDVAVTLWSHSNLGVPVALDRIIRYAVVTPDLHRVHHSVWEPETNSNYGAVFPIWDLLLGTFNAKPRENHETMQLGLEEVRGREAQRPIWLLKSISEGRLGDTRVGASQ